MHPLMRQVRSLVVQVTAKGSERNFIPYTRQYPCLYALRILTICGPVSIADCPSRRCNFGAAEFILVVVDKVMLDCPLGRTNTFGRQCQRQQSELVARSRGSEDRRRSDLDEQGSRREREDWNGTFEWFKSCSDHQDRCFGYEYGYGHGFSGENPIP